MNIHGLKLKYKNMVRLLERELNKKESEQDLKKVKRLQRVKVSCGRKIKELKKARDGKKK